MFEEVKYLTETLLQINKKKVIKYIFFHFKIICYQAALQWSSGMISNFGNQGLSYILTLIFAQHSKRWSKSAFSMFYMPKKLKKNSRNLVQNLAKNGFCKFAPERLLSAMLKN